MATTVDVGNLFGSAATGLLKSIETKAIDLATKVEAVSKETANTIRGYQQRILETLQGRMDGTISNADSQLAIKTWKVATKSALKSLEVQAAWEAHDALWATVGRAFSIASALLGEIVL